MRARGKAKRFEVRKRAGARVGSGLDYVLARLSRILPPAQVEVWLSSHNAHLGARPIDVLRMCGAGPVVAAIDAEAEGAYA